MSFPLSKLDDCDHGLHRIHQLRRQVAHKKTIRQMVEIDEYENFGIGACLDNWPQIAEVDCHKYHQAFVHQAMLPLTALGERGAFPRELDVCILGGGDFGVVQELTRYKHVRRIVQVDWDLEFMEMAKEHLEGIHGGAWKDPRLHVETKMCDAFDFLPNTTETFDVVFGDLTDLSNMTELMPNFAALLSRIMRPHGVFITQAGELSNVRAALDVALKGYASLAPHFKQIWISKTHIPSFGYEQSFATVTNLAEYNPLALSRQEINELIAGAVASPLKEYSGSVHHALYAISPFLLEKLRESLGAGFTQARYS